MSIDLTPRAPDASLLRFQTLFGAWAKRVRRRLAARHLLSGLAIGLTVALIPALVAWRTRNVRLRQLAPIVGLAGAVVGGVIARRRRWNDTEVALYLDDRLDARETITTAVQLHGGARPDEHEVHAAVLSAATLALTNGDRRRARPRLLRPVLALLPVSAAGLVAIALAPLPPAPVVVSPPGAATVQLAEVEGLEKVVALGQVSARDEAQKQRLEQLAREAERLRQDLKRGLEKREALDRVARLREGILAERLSLGAGEQRAGFESAVSKLAEAEQTKRAAKALGDHDLQELDAEMDRLANQREKADRELAKRKLSEAADASRRAGAPDVAKALEDEAEKFAARAERAELLRDLAKALEAAGLSTEDVARRMEALDRKASDQAARQLSDALGKALEGLTPEERKRLAEKLAEQAKKGGLESNPSALKELADDLSTTEGQQRLQERLRDLANQDLQGEEAKRERGLEDAEQGAGEAEGDIGRDGQPGRSGGGAPTPVPIPGQGGERPGGTNRAGGEQAGRGGNGGGHDRGTADHGGGTTGPVNADTLKSRAQARWNDGHAMPGIVRGTTAGRAGATANVQGTGGLAAVGPSEVAGVEHSDVPEEYREQVRQYFQP